MTKTKASTSPAENQRERDNRALARRIADEAIVLLKNDGALPIAPGKIALYGAGVTKTIFGGSGSGEVNARHCVNVLEGFENAGYTVTTKRWLNDYERFFEQEKTAFNTEMGKSFLKIRSGADANNILGKSFIYPAGRAITEQDVKDSDTEVCLYVLSRQSGEGSDRTPEDFVLRKQEIEQIEFCASHYEKTVLVINVGASMDLTNVDTIEGLDAILFMCQLGQESGNALADVVSGAVTPSGKLTDTWVMNYSQVPFGNRFSSLSPESLEQDYEEGIFVGYRYYQTAGIEPRYPFGYGLSYTDFSVEVKSTELFQSYVTVKAMVTNTGDTYAGKAVVQAYLSEPAVILSKPYQQLAAFVKTPVLKPGESVEAELRFDLREEASFDETLGVYLLEPGAYVVRVGQSSDKTVPVAVIDVPKPVVAEETKRIDKRREVEELQLRAEPEELPEDLPHFKLLAKNSPMFRHREQGSSSYSEEAFRIGQMDPQELIELLLGKGMHFFAFRGSFVAPGNAANTTSAFEDDLGLPSVSLADGPAGLRLLSESVQYPTGQVKPLKNAISVFDYLPEKASKLLLGNPKFGKMLYQYATFFPVGTAVASTWNADLAEAFGAAVSTEMSEFGVTFWLAPGMNIHRNPLCGRNFEYFSEDPMLTGSIAAAICKGVATRPGNYVTIKHFCANNQEFQRNKASSNVSERTLREIYLRPFKKAIREGGAKAVMTSYNPVNGLYNVENRSLLEDYLRWECGFDGVVMTDWTSTGPGLAKPARAIAAGNDMLMPGMITDRIPLMLAVNRGELGMDDLRRSAERVYRLIRESERAKEWTKQR